MKTIFREEHALPDFIHQWIDEEGRYDRETDAYIPVVCSEYRTGFLAMARACCDGENGVLVVELTTTLYNRFNWRPADRKVLELHSTRAAALRRAIAIADDWYREVEAAIPPERTEAELLAEFAYAKEGATLL